MTFFSESSIKFLENSQNPAVQYTEIIKNTNLLYETLKTGQIKFPLLNYNFNESLLNIDNSISEVFTKLTKLDKETNKYCGYDPTKIVSAVTGNPLDLLDDIDDEYRLVISNLNQIYNSLNKNYNSHKLFQNLLSNLNQLYINNTNLFNYTQSTTSFYYIFNKLIHTYTNFDKTNISSIIYIYDYILLNLLYTKSYDILTPISNNIFENKLFIDDYLADSFIEYTYMNTELIQNEINQYILNNVLNFGYDRSSLDLKEKINNIIKLTFDDINDLISLNKQKIFNTSIIYNSLSDLVKMLINNTSFHYLNNSSQNDNMESFYEYSYKLLNFNDNDFRTFLMEEDIILANSNKYITSYIENIQELTNIPLQYVPEQVFYLNAVGYSFSKLCNNFIINYDIINLRQVKTWTESYFNFNKNNVDNIYNYINNNKILYHKDLFKYSFYLSIKESVNNFIESDDFKLKITKKLMNRLQFDLKDDYYIFGIDWYTQIDKIINFIKLLILKHVLDDLLYKDVIDKLDEIISEQINSNELQLDTNAIEVLINKERQNFKFYYNIYNSFFKSSVISKYTETYLNSNFSIS